MTDDLSKGFTVTGAYYADEGLRKLRKALKSKRRGKLPARTLLLRCLLWLNVAMNYYFIHHICQILAPSDLYLFPLLKEHLSGTHFSSDNDVIVYVEVFLQGQDELFYKTGIQKLQK